jgi:hypothetical protein
MKVKKRKLPTPQSARRALVKQLLDVADFTLRTEPDVDVQEEALSMKRILQARLREIEASPAAN